jgi:glutamate/tyrosine decarboxylase-like PLP-dependent enzyme
MSVRWPPRVDAGDVREMLGGPLREDGEDPTAVIEALAAGAEPGLVASAGPRYFGFVTAGALPMAVAADWLVSAWDQNISSGPRRRSWCR